MKNISKGMLSAIFVLLTIAIIIVPLPSVILDFMFIINLLLSIMILLTTMFITHTLQFSIFPSVMLVTTLLRLALNISSTRLILQSGGDIGGVSKIIQSFGNFVIGGNPVIGFIIFLIIMVVQFLVITKGTERVSEVTARFTLDAMPGKQMAIDADLNAGIIDEKEAFARRESVQRESDFYGAMDGATKFVKGDAIASIVITVINLIGGTIMGMVMSTMTFGEVLTSYALATVGDGLASQLPALLISTATGVIVTRATSDNNLSDDLANQVLSQPKALIMAGATMLFMILIPGSPKIQLILGGGGFIFLGYTIRSRNNKLPVLAEDQQEEITEESLNQANFYKNIDNIYSLLNVEAIEMKVGYSLIPIVDTNGGSGGLIDRLVMFRKQFAEDFGVVVPSVRFRDEPMINPNQYLILIKGEEVARGEILVDYYLAVEPNEVTKEIDGIETVEPAYGIPSKWISSDIREEAESYGYVVLDPVSVIINHFSQIIKVYMHEILSRQDINVLLENLAKHNPAIVKDVVPAIISVADMQKVLCNLLRENIPIRDLETILETLGEYGPSVKDMDMLTEYVRQSLKRTITRQYVSGNVLKVITVDQNIEQLIINSVKKNEQGTYIALEPEMMQGIVGSVINQIEKIKGIVQTPIILTSPVVRIYLKKMLDQFNPNLTVLSFSEIDSSVQIQALGNVQM